MRILFALLISCSIAYANDFNAFIERLDSVPDSLSKKTLVDSFMQKNPILPLTNGTECIFIFRGNASRIIVTGDHKQWSGKGDTMQRVKGTDIHFVRNTFPIDARIDYKFINGSNWILDPKNPHTCAGGFGPNSELRMPGYPDQPELIGNADIPKGTIFDTTFRSNALNNSRAIKVYLPPGYSQALQYPVILFHDGLDYVNLAKAPAVIDRLIAMNKIRPIIAVFVPAVNRTPEYAGNSIDVFQQFITNDVMNWVDNRFSTTRNPEYRAVAGASNGGNIALYCALKAPQVFGKVASQSSNVINSIMSGFDTYPPLPITLYADIGIYDIPQLIPLVKQFKQVMVKRGYNHIYKEVNEGHSWGNWKANMNEYLEYFFPPIPSSVKSSESRPLITDLEYRIDSLAIQLTFRLSIPIKGMTILLMDINGKILSETLLTAREQGDLSEELILNSRLSSGMYFLQFRSEQTMFTYHITIQ
jgi:enterochelin esterase family protein